MLRLIGVLALTLVIQTSAPPPTAAGDPQIRVGPGADLRGTDLAAWDAARQSLRVELIHGARLVIEQALLLETVRATNATVVKIEGDVDAAFRTLTLEARDVQDGATLAVIDAVESRTMRLGPLPTGREVEIGLVLELDPGASGGPIAPLVLQITSQ